MLRTLSPAELDEFRKLNRAVAEELIASGAVTGLREQFAMHAPITLGEAREFCRNTGAGLEPPIDAVLDMLAQMRWRYADAMIKGKAL